MKCSYCGSEDCTNWELEFNSIESSGRSVYSRLCNHCNQVMYMAGLFYSQEAKRDFYADREQMNLKDKEFCRSMGIKL